MHTPAAPMEAETADQTTILGRYRVLQEAGSGGFASVKLAWDARMQRRVAVKEIDLSSLAARQGIVLDDVNDLPQTALTGLDEARTAALLASPHIVTVYDFEVRDNIAYLIMEYVDGLTLGQLLAKLGDGITVDMVTAIFDGVAAALRYAHENQVLHLDIKPDNVMINHEGQVKVMDFGLARLSDAQGYQSAAGGTIGYMPPEQIMREPLDGRCDEWALASLSYEMISGENPFLARDLSQALDRIEDAEIVLPSLCLEGLSAEIDDVIFYALNPDREKRYDTVADFAEEMDCYLGDAQKGRKQLAAFMQEIFDEGREPEMASHRLPRPRRQLSPRAKSALLRGAAAVEVGVLTCAGVSAISVLGGLSSPLSWAIIATAAACAAISPRRAGVLGPVALVAALIACKAYALGAIFGVLTLVWWLRAGLEDDASSVGALSESLVGAVGLGPLAPFICGFLSRPSTAMANALYAALMALCLGCCGSGNIVGWSFPLGLFDAERTTQNALTLACDPTTWIVLASWLGAALICALTSRRRTSLAIAGILLATALLMAASFAAGWLHAGMTTDFNPVLSVLVPSMIAGIIAVIAHLVIPPEVRS